MCHWKHFSLSQHVVGDLDLLHSQLRHLWLAGALPQPTPGWLKMPRPKIWGDGRGSAAGDMCVGHQGLPREKKEHDTIWYNVINRWNLGLMLLILSIFEANHLPQTPWRTSCFFCRVSIFGSWKKEPTWAASAWLRSEFEPWSQFYSFAVFTIFYLRTMSNTAHHVFILSRECKPRIP